MDDSDRLDDVLQVLGDERSRTILRELARNDGPLAAQQLAEQLEIPQSTTYRKLDDLTETPLVEERVGLDEGGHHRARYSVTVDGVVVSLDGDGLHVETRLDGEEE